VVPSLLHILGSAFRALVLRVVNQGGSFDISRKLLATGYTTDKVSVTLVVSTIDTESDKVISVWNAFVTKAADERW